MRASLLVLTCLTALAPAAAPAWAQSPLHTAQLFNRPTPPAAIDDDDAPPARGPDAGALVVRIERLEKEIRALTGQIEQLQIGRAHV